MLVAAYLLSQVEGIAAITEISAAVLTSQINAGIIRARGKGDPYTSAMYGAPLGLLVLMKGPFRVPFSIGNAREFGKYFGSVLVDFGMDQVQQAGVKDAVANREDENRGSHNPQ